MNEWLCFHITWEILHPHPDESQIDITRALYLTVYCTRCLNDEGQIHSEWYWAGVCYTELETLHTAESTASFNLQENQNKKKKEREEKKEHLDGSIKRNHEKKKSTHLTYYPYKLIKTILCSVVL